MYMGLVSVHGDATTLPLSAGCALKVIVDNLYSILTFSSSVKPQIFFSQSNHSSYQLAFYYSIFLIRCSMWSGQINISNKFVLYKMMVPYKIRGKNSFSLYNLCWGLLFHNICWCYLVNFG